jgi:hypothetical protein
MGNELVCWKCGASIAKLPLPLGRAEVCPACRADLHVCRLCEFYDTRAANSCREPVADLVQNKERSNFCGYFKARAGAYHARTDTGARTALDALFGGSGAPTAPTDADRAREELEKLFGKKP